MAQNDIEFTYEGIDGENSANEFEIDKPATTTQKKNSLSIAPETFEQIKPAKNKKSSPQRTELDATIRIAIAEAKTMIIAEHLSEAKLLEYKINQILSPFIVNKALEKPLTRIKKLLATHCKKMF